MRLRLASLFAAAAMAVLPAGGALAETGGEPGTGTEAGGGRGTGDGTTRDETNPNQGGSGSVGSTGSRRHGDGSDPDAGGAETGTMAPGTRGGTEPPAR